MGRAKEDCISLTSAQARKTLGQKPDATDIRNLLDRYGDTFAAPLHLLVNSNAARSKSALAACHVCSTPMAKGSVTKTANPYGSAALCVCCPELVLAQLCSSLSYGQVAQLAYEWCGLYALHAFDFNLGPTTGFDSALPLINAADIRGFARANQAVRGCRDLGFISRYVVDNSASPMETILAILLCFPVKWGGYGLPMPKLNAPIAMQERQKLVSRKTCYIADLSWPSAKLVVEYDSDVFHTGHSRISQDALRRNILTDLGYTVVTVTSDQIFQVEKTDELARQLARKLKKEKKTPVGDWQGKKQKLRQDLLPSNYDQR